MQQRFTKVSMQPSQMSNYFFSVNAHLQRTPSGLLLVLLLLLSSSISTPVSAAQQAPDAGSLLRQVEPPTLPKARTVPTLPATPLPPAKDDGVAIPVREFRFQGNTLLSNEQLQQVVKPWLGKTLTVTELKYVADAVAQRYHEAGYLVRAYLPQQDVKDGSILIVIIEARFGQVHIDGDAAKLRVSSERIKKMVVARQQSDSPFRTSDIERATLLINDTPGVTAKTVLIPGSSPGHTDVTVQAENNPLTATSLAVDNAGTPSTGRVRFLPSIMFNSPTSAGDSVRLSGLFSEGNQYARVRYGRPIGYDGLRAGISLGYLKYKLGGDYAYLDADGSALTVQADVSYPLLRSSISNTTLTGNVAQRHYVNRSKGTTTSDKKVNALTVGLNGDHVDGLAGGGSTFYGANLTVGDLDLSANAANQAQDSAGARTAGSYQKLGWNIGRLQRVNDLTNVWVSAYGQFGNKSLDSSETMSLGGAQGVRAYPALEASGDSGWLTTVELRRKLRDNLTVTGFFDGGQVRLKSTLVDPAKTYTLKGVGVSMSWADPGSFLINVSLAHRLGHNPLMDPVTGNDSDGTHEKYRFWLSASKRF